MKEIINKSYYWYTVESSQSLKLSLIINHIVKYYRG